MGYRLQVTGYSMLIPVNVRGMLALSQRSTSARFAGLCMWATSYNGGGCSNRRCWSCSSISRGQCACTYPLKTAAQVSTSAIVMLLLGLMARSAPPHLSAYWFSTALLQGNSISRRSSSAWSALWMSLSAPSSTSFLGQMATKPPLVANIWQTCRNAHSSAVTGQHSSSSSKWSQLVPGPCNLPNSTDQMSLKGCATCAAKSLTCAARPLLAIYKSASAVVECREPSEAASKLTLITP